MRTTALFTLLAVLLAGNPAVAETTLEPSEAQTKIIELRTATDRSRVSLDELAAAVDSATKPLLDDDEANDAEAEKALDALSDDPITLRALAAAARDDNPELAALLFSRSLEKQEINLYQRVAGTSYAKAIEHEFFGRWEESRKQWRETFDTDVLTAYVVLSRFSIDKERTALLNEARAHVTKLVDAAKAGENAPILKTRTGGRNLTVVEPDVALEKFKAGEALRYAYIEKLDLTGQTFPDGVACNRCVVGEIDGWDSKYTGGFSFRGIVLGDLQLGRAWTGEKNRSRALPPAEMDTVFLDKVVVFGDLLMDSVKFSNKANFPFVVVDGTADFRNSSFENNVDFRFSWFRGPLILQGATFAGAAYFGHLRAGGVNLTRASATGGGLLFDSAEFAGPFEAARATLHQGATFENAVFASALELQHCDLGDRLNLSRAQMVGPARLTYVELDDLDVFGAIARDEFALSDSVVRGNARFALDGLNRRLHLRDPHPLHALYKQYQGDVDSDDLLTEGNQYGVTHVDDLAAQFTGNTSFANTYFEKFVGFEGVVFGTEDSESYANFYNAQLYGEAHFERTVFWSTADFRSISGNEISFNAATLHDTWMLDDANVPGRLSLNDIRFTHDATLSFHAARLAHFGIGIGEVRKASGASRLFHERCATGQDVDLDDPRMHAARWDDATQQNRPTDGELDRIVSKLCLDHIVGEFVVLRDSFNKRGMTDEADWAYWHLRHYTNVKEREHADGFVASARAWVQWIVFENAFGWGVRLGNLFWTSLVIILLYMVLIRRLCGQMVVEWDDTVMPLAELPRYALFVISLHSFLGRARDWKSKSSNRVWKVLYTTEMIIGIILITFFIGAYARIILR